MRVRVSYTVDVDDDLRRAINYHDDGDPTVEADREQIRAFFESYGGTMTDDVLSDWAMDRPCPSCGHAAHFHVGPFLRPRPCEAEVAPDEECSCSESRPW